MKRWHGRTGTAFAAVMLATILAGTTSCREAGPEQSDLRSPRRKPNILLISIDALRADHLGCYGYDRATSPFIDELARRGVFFEHASVNTHGTTPSHTTMLTGLYQETHRVALTDVARSGIPREVTLLPEILKREGYETIAVTGAGNVGGRFGFARGFDEFDKPGGGVER
jgi:arylsulfatase A-like enzyme